MRMVLCNAIDPVRRTFTMYTNRESRKGRVEWTPDEACDAYFASRPLEARLGAWASRQSEPVPSRAALLTELAAVADRFDAREETDVVPRPPFWGGFTLVADSVELWVSRRGRIHDRAVWRRSGEGLDWEITRLQP
jgi:pyridoxamine 5'-phosphate oxidase